MERHIFVVMNQFICNALRVVALLHVRWRRGKTPNDTTRTRARISIVANDMATATATASAMPTVAPFLTIPSFSTPSGAGEPPSWSPSSSASSVSSSLSDSTASLVESSYWQHNLDGGAVWIVVGVLAGVIVMLMCFMARRQLAAAWRTHVAPRLKRQGSRGGGASNQSFTELEDHSMDLEDQGGENSNDAMLGEAPGPSQKYAIE